MTGKQLALDDEAAAALAELRKVCLALPNVAETLTFGNPTFKAGRKAFAVLDRYRGVYCVWILCDAATRQHLLLTDDAWFPAPYDKAQAALCRKLKGIDWAEFRRMVLASYERAVG